MAVILSGTASDAHTWNLVFLQLLLEELGRPVINLGPCVPDQVLVDACVRLKPELVVVASVNGHGFQDGIRLVRLLRAHRSLDRVPVVIGGMLDTGADRTGEERRHKELEAAGYDAVFADSDDIVSRFIRFVTTRLNRSACAEAWSG
ncbi:methylaspartate mutase [Frankia sp. B2]|uniref:cobalamin B12-binding domain-containing protein n=1 Tax=Frankia sp. B2 TaxID=2541730 RepID=UPI00106A7F47|nr:cobalamin-dependent protein [Frankia sp. B2]TFE31009.1 methylaspartate mutase [Frankia sp. B2]